MEGWKMDTICELCICYLVTVLCLGNSVVFDSIFRFLFQAFFLTHSS
jgi:hypothetical protein